MNKPKIALLGKMNHKQAKSWLKALQENLPEETICLFSELSPAERQQVEIAIVANPDPADVETLPQLRWMQSLWSGVEKLVTKCQSDVPIVRMIDSKLSQSMAEAVLAWTMFLHRDMPAYAIQQQQKIWQSREHKYASEVSVSILGLGSLGQAAASLLHKVGYQVSGWSQSSKQLKNIDTFNDQQGLQQMLSNTDILVCLLPLTETTAGIINQELFKKLPSGASLINFSRGPLVNTADLIEALKSKHLNHAVLDVFDQEPLPDDSPLWSNPAVTVLPHISAPSDTQSVSQTAADNIKSYRQTGIVPPSVDRQKGY